MNSLHFTFDSEIFLWGGDSPWHFVALPHWITDDIDDSITLRGGFGSIKVRVTIGGTSWNTSIFPDSKRKTFILPIKKGVRDAEELKSGDTTTVELMVLTP